MGQLVVPKQPVMKFFFVADVESPGVVQLFRPGMDAQLLPQLPQGGFQRLIPRRNVARGRGIVLAGKGILVLRALLQQHLPAAIHPAHHPHMGRAMAYARPMGLVPGYDFTGGVAGLVADVKVFHARPGTEHKPTEALGAMEVRLGRINGTPAAEMGVDGLVAAVEIAPKGRGSVYRPPKQPLQPHKGHRVGHSPPAPVVL